VEKRCTQVRPYLHHIQPSPKSTDQTPLFLLDPSLKGATTVEYFVLANLI
jgi:hypothetical protein